MTFMEANLATTNVLLSIMAAVSVLEALAVIGFFLGAFMIYRRIVHVIGGIEERQVAPAAARVNAILDDIKDVTSTVREEAGRVERVVSRAITLVRRFRDKANRARPTGNHDLVRKCPESWGKLKKTTGKGVGIGVAPCAGQPCLASDRPLTNVRDRCPRFALRREASPLSSLRRAFLRTRD